MKAFVSAVSLGFAGLAAMLLFSIPVSVDAQLALAGSLLVAMTSDLESGPRSPRPSAFFGVRRRDRHALSVLALHQHVAGAGRMVGFAFGVVLLVAETYCVLILASSA